MHLVKSTLSTRSFPHSEVPVAHCRTRVAYEGKLDFLKLPRLRTSILPHFAKLLSIPRPQFGSAVGKKPPNTYRCVIAKR